MGGAVGNVVYADDDLAGQLPLDSQIPLVNVSVPRRGRAQVVVVGVPPISQCSILRALRTGKAVGKRIFQSRVLAGKVVLSKEHCGSFAERSSRILEICGWTHAKINPCPA